MASKKVKKEKISKRGKGDVKQSVKVSVRIGDVKAKKKRKYKRKPRGEGGGDLATVGETRTLYGNLPPPPPQQIIYTPELPPAFQPPKQISGLLEDVKKERNKLLEDIKKEVKSTAIKEIQKAQGAEQRSELERIGFQEPVPLPKLLDKVEEPIQSFTQIKSAEPIIQEPEEEQNLPFQGEAFIGIEEMKSRGRRQGIKNRPKEIIEAEKKERLEKKKIKEAKKAEEEAKKAEEEAKKLKKQTKKQKQKTKLIIEED